jgi:hypothetical protein
VQSSNFSGRDASFASFLARSLTLLERELPWGYAAVCRALGEREVLIEVDGEKTPVMATGSVLRVERSSRAPVVECRTSRRAIVDLVDGKMTLVEAVESELVWLSGTVDDLLAFHDGLMAYLGGAVRSPSFVGLLGEFREFAEVERG